MAWQLYMIRGPPTRADILLDTTCFSTSEFVNFDDFQVVSQDYSMPSSTNPATATGKPINMANPDVLLEMLRRRVLSNSALDVRARYNHPTFPSATLLTTFIQEVHFQKYISNEFPPPILHLSAASTTTNHEPLRKEVNATIANSLLNTVLPSALQVGTMEWVFRDIFPDKVLPTAFNERCLDTVPECWDRSKQQFSNFPDQLGEHAIQDWLNHLAHTLGVQHGLIQEEVPEEDSSNFVDEDANSDEDVNSEEDVSDDKVDSDPRKTGFLIRGIEDRSFSRVSHTIAPTGGYHLRKPDIILLKQNIHHFLKNGNHRP
ncbi:hypothetical protein CPB84DRAFT_1852270 [Gymnopilus junonius]|uniref:Uncharacterized protein n=1 Tax=Gymnopilus junonius TaxID=109634 RepID=A0A9P5TGM9_GYMJU|nr:hypothetical protein CPB84DRAFT_1852270 [Gymnopilus junonius]